MTSKIAIIGGGPAGCMCAYFLQNDFDVTIFDKSEPLKTLLPTGGGRCNLAHSEFDFRELAKNYPRGEKFLYSIFSRFSTSDTIEFFKQIGIETYTQDDFRIFPKSDSAKDVREKFLKSLNKVKFVKKEIKEINSLDFDVTVIATGGHGIFDIIPKHMIIPPKPSLVGLKTTKKFPAGVSLKNVKCNNLKDDILFTHEGISGPLIYKISSINARKEFPYTINLNFADFDDLQEILNSNPHKNIKNLLAEFLPKSFCEHILNELKINGGIKCHAIDGKTRDKITDKLKNYEITVTGTAKGGEIVTCGGVSLDEVNPKTLESKLIPNLYFCGEVLDIDGFCGGFNLQNCWSTGYVVAQSILRS